MAGARVLGSTLRRWLAFGVVAVLAVSAWALFAGSTSAADTAEPRPVTVTVPVGPAEPGTLALDADLYVPAVTPAPAVLLAHGFGGSKKSVADDARRLVDQGLVVLAYSARGFGQSEGRISLDSLDAEVADARAAIDYLAAQDEVQLDGDGDPRVGVAGTSYGGALSLMAAGTDPRIDAVVAVATWNNLQQALFPNAIDAKTAAPATSGRTLAAVPAGADGVYKQGWASALLASIIGAGDDDASATPGCGRLDPDLCAAYLAVAQTGRLTPDMSRLLAASSPATVADAITAPTLLVQGESDTLFGLDQADATARQLAANGTTVAVSWYAGGHNGGGPDDATTARMDGWFAHYLRGVGAAPSTAFEYAVAVSTNSRGRARTRVLATESYPGLDGSQAPTTQVDMVPAGPQVILNPPGGQPSAITSLPGLSGSSASLAAAAALPGQSALFTSEPFTEPLIVTGSVPVTVSLSRLPTPGAPVADEAVLYLSLVNLPADAPSAAAGPTSLAPAPDSAGPDVSSLLSSLGAAPVGGAIAAVRVENVPADGTPVDVDVHLAPVAVQIPAGNRLAVRVATTDQGYAGSTSPAAFRVSLVGATVPVPAAGGVRIADDDGASTALVVTVVALALLMVAGLVVAGRGGRRRPHTDHVEDADSTPPAPLVIQGLAKTYPGGIAAVSDVSLRVERGQVLGLLGPNGAGKTTSLRMVMGLIAPTAGSITIFGQPAGPGAPVLSRIGSFVEGSGFLPHLTGVANLRLYWQATGRPEADAQFDAALAIADLGVAVHRKVRTYSQGMRQRLAIAQAMLGLPDLLLLDEPTNGLDPPQIHAMREVLRRYAATGRTVVISSHLLSEVEQTCTHVVVMSRGRTIASGSVAELVAGSGATLIGCTDPDRAAEVLRGMPGIDEVEPAPDGVAVSLGSLPLSTVLTTLIDANIEVTSAAPRNRLEDVFLELVGTGPAGGESALPGNDSRTEGQA